MKRQVCLCFALFLATSEQLLSKTYAEQQRARINFKKATPHYAAGYEEEGDTMYLCVADREGNVVSLIQSLYNGFGSGIVGGDTGILHTHVFEGVADPRCGGLALGWEQAFCGQKHIVGKKDGVYDYQAISSWHPRRYPGSLS